MSASIGKTSQRDGNLLAVVLAGAWRHSPPPPQLSWYDLDEVAPLLIDSGAGALGWWRVRHSDLSKRPAAQALRQAYRQNAILGTLHERRIQEVIALLHAAGVVPVLIKGWAIARLYPERALRVSGDIDLLVRPSQLTRVRRALERQPDLLPDVGAWHEELDRFSEQAWGGLYARAETVRLGEIDVHVLGPEDHLALLCMHYLRHGAWRPIWLCDISAALESRPPSFDWDLCLDGDWGRADWIACTLGLANRLLGGDASDTPVADRAAPLPRWLVPQVLKQWERPSPRQHDPPDLIRNGLRRPIGLPSALRARWSYPIQATIRMNGPFNELPRFPFQLADYGTHVARSLGRLGSPSRGG